MSYKELIEASRAAALPTKEQDAEEQAHKATPEQQVNLCIKVPVSLRRHWVAEAKREGMTLTAVISKALNDRFGTP